MPAQTGHRGPSAAVTYTDGNLGASRRRNTAFGKKRMTQPADKDAALQFVLDRIAIEDCLTRYSHAVDRYDPELLRGVYWPDATDDHVFVRGGRDQAVEWIMESVKSQDQAMHSLSNMLIRIEGSEARVETYFNSYHRVRGRDGTPKDILMAGRYLDRMEKRDGEWRIADRKVAMDWWRNFSDSADWHRGLFGTKIEVGKRGDADPSAALFGDRLHRR